MQSCNQSSNQTIYEHGIAVRDKLFELINSQNLSQWRIPNWFNEHKDKLFSNLYDWEILETYTTFHDCGKPYCRTVDENGKQHFPNHANTSADKWLEVDGSNIIANLIRNDMMVHTMKSSDIEEFCKDPKMACSLLLTALAEIHANSILFGGIESVSFKIKWKQIDKIGKKICSTIVV